MNKNGTAGRLALCAALLSGATGVRAQSAMEFLQGSMKKYQTLHSFQAECKMTLPGGVSAQRSITYAKPNRYRVTMTIAKGQAETSVSNGKDVNEYATIQDTEATQYPAPATIAAADSLFMQQPTLCGSILYSFFGGPGKLTAFVSDTKSIQYAPSVTLDGQKCRVVKFMARGKYGQTEIAISANDGLVRRIQYGNAAVESVRGSGQKIHVLGAPTPTRITTTEIYSHIVTDKEIADATFDTKTPPTPQEIAAAKQAAQQEEDAGPKPPVPVGKAAPGFEVTALVGGAKTKLADLKGKVVLIDFWATWCPPCRKGLPETQKFFETYANKGLVVMAISDEEKDTVAPFIKENNYSFPTFLDTTRKANTAYNIMAIPTVVVIDKEGKLSSYMVGLQDPETILAALKKAGLDTP